MIAKVKAIRASKYTKKELELALCLSISLVIKSFMYNTSFND